MRIDIEKIVREAFASKKIAVVGDAVADQFLRGNIDRVSREAPVFILKHEETETVGGGAANTASNVAALGAAVSLVGVIGEDSNGRKLRQSLQKRDVDTDSLIASENFHTTTKLRILAGQRYASRQQVIRVDYIDEDFNISESLRKELKEASKQALNDADAVILSDYGYGIADLLFDDVIKLAEDRPILLDSRYRLQDFPGITAATPNKEEIERYQGTDFSADQIEVLRDKLNVEHLLVTLGNQGMCLGNKNGNTAIPVIGSDQPVDVTGAGDTVISTFALGLACDLDALTAARIANHAGGIVVMKHGTATVSTEELIESISTHEPEFLKE